MKQGEIWLIDLNPIIGSEQAGQRPFVIISGNLLNEYSNVIIGCPLTSKVKQLRSNIVVQPTANNGLKSDSEILTFHIRSVSKYRLKQKIGSITPKELSLIKINVNKLLDY